MRRSIFPCRPSTTRKQLPRQPAAVSGAATPRSLGPLPLARWGLWAPSPFVRCRHRAGSSISCYFVSAVRALSLASPGVLSQPLLSLGRFLGRRPPFVPPLPGDGISLTHSPRREVASGPVTRVVPTSRLLGVSKRWRCFGSRTLPFTNGGVVFAVVPCNL